MSIYVARLLVVLIARQKAHSLSRRTRHGVELTFLWGRGIGCRLLSGPGRPARILPLLYVFRENGFLVVVLDGLFAVSLGSHCGWTAVAREVDVGYAYVSGRCALV